MAGLVLELQRDALDMKVPIADLLRKALVISRKLDLAEVQKWIEQELSGYGNNETPDYRKLFGQPKVHNPYRGWQPIVSEDPKYMDALSERHLAQSIAELEDLTRGDTTGALTMPYGTKAAASIRKAIGRELEVSLFVSRQDIIKVLDTVRNKVLEWALDLEKRGILGADMTFSKEEKVTASEIHYTTVNNIGSMTNSQLQQHSSGSQVMGGDVADQVAKIVETIATHIEQLNLSSEARRELEAELATLRAQVVSPKPKHSIIKDCLLSAKTIIEGAVGNMVASGLLSTMAPVIAAVS